MGSEGAVERELHYQHERAEPAIHSLREKCEWENERGQEDKEQTQTVNADEIFSANGWNPGMAFDQLKAGSGGIEVLPQGQGDNGTQRIESQRKWAGVIPRHNADEKSASKREQNQSRDQVSHA